MCYEDPINVAICSRLPYEDEMKRRILDCKANLTRQNNEHIIGQRFERLLED